MKKSERKNCSARMRMRQEEKEWDEKFSMLEVEHQRWLNTKIVLQVVFVAVMSLSMWLTGKYCANMDMARSTFFIIISAYAVLTVITKWKAIDCWDADINQIANGRLFAFFTLMSAMPVFLW